MEEEEESLAVYIPQQVEHSSDEKSQEVEEPSNVPQQCEVVPEIDDSQLVGGSPFVADEIAVVEEEATPMVAEEAPPVVDPETEMEMEIEVAERSRGRGKRKRGRQNKVPTKAPSKKKEEEDVCFICFDGGNLVLCDRRGCPKAYHPPCVNRDDAFFRSKGRWNCGWHICSNCEKAAHYMCYTCTYSLCKGCIKEAEILCVRGNKGFCGTCMRTVMLIEKNEQGNKEMPQVNFDDKNSWEHLFKDYWIDLKGKLSLTLDELSQARNPWKGSGTLAQKEESSDEQYDANDDQGSNSDSSDHLEVTDTKKRKARRRSKPFKEEGSSSVARAVGVEGISYMSGDTEWASKELLEFVAHMKNGDTSILSQFDVQALLLEYIKQNSLRDPRRKSQIVCDSRLENLFGKARVGHFEMLKLLELHFLIKEDAQADDIQGEIIDTETSRLEAESSADALTKVGMDKRRKTRKKGEERGLQTNLDDYAAIDVHNINLLYLRRNLMEELLEDRDKFHEKVVGSFVRIRISGLGQKHDMYRLVPVVGTQKAAGPYKTGKRTTDFVLEILNLNKTEFIQIDTISNQDFSEDECKRLRQSIKCGLINRMTVGDVQEKAMTLQTLRVNDWLETEKLRLCHLRDRASEKGRRKELRECVEKLQLLNAPEERLRRVQEIPEVHADPNMDPSYESEGDEGEQDDKKQDKYVRPRDSGFGRKGRESISQGKGSSASNDTWNGSRKNSSTSWEASKSMSNKGLWDKGESATSAGDRTSESSWGQVRDAHQSNSSEKPKNQVPATGSGIGLETTLVSAPAVILSPKISETDKMWNYQDPSGKIQGPFSMVQLRKWSTTGYFPTDLRIWRTTEKQEDSILLNDALKGKFHKELPQWGNSFSQPQRDTVVSDNSRENNWGGGWKGNSDSTWIEKNQSDGSRNSNWKDAVGTANGNTELANSDGWGSVSTPDPKVGQTGYSSWGLDSSKINNAWSGRSQVHSPHLSPSSGKPHLPPFHQGEGQGDGRWNSGQNRANAWNLNRSASFQSSIGHGYEKQSRSPGKSSGENVRSQMDITSSKNRAAPSSVETLKLAAGGWGANQDNRNNSSNLPSPTPKPGSAGWAGGVSENKWSTPPTLTVQPSNSGWATTTCLGGNGVQDSSAGMTERNVTTGLSEQHHISVKPSAGGRDSISTPASRSYLSDTSDLGESRDCSNPSTPTPMPSIGGHTGSQGVEIRRVAVSTVSLQQTGSGWGSTSNPGVNEAQYSHPTMNEPIKGATEWSGDSPTVAKPVGEWGPGSVNATSKPAEKTDDHVAASDPESGHPTHPSTLSPILVKLTDNVDGGASGSLANQSVSVIPTKDNTSGLTSISVKGGGDLIKGSEKDPSNSLHELSPQFVGMDDVLSSATGKILSHPTLTSEPHGIVEGGILDTQMKAGAHSPTGAALDGETRHNVSIGTQGFVPEPPASVLAGSFMNAGNDAASGITTFQGWGSSSAQKPEMNPIHVPANEQEPPTASSIQALATQKTVQPEFFHRGGGPSSHDFSSTDHPLNHTIPGLVSDSVPSGQSVGPPNTRNIGWSTRDVIPGAALNINQSNLLAQSDTQNTLLSGAMLETNIRPAPVTTGWGIGTQENASNWIPAPENLNASLMPTQGNANVGWGGPAQGNTNMGWGALPQGTPTAVQAAVPQGNSNMGWGAPAAGASMWGSQQKHNGDRFSSHQDRGFHGGDSGHGGGRPSWSRQSSFGSGGGGGGSSRLPHKGQRVCKFHENGHCKKGADCDYLHP